MQQIYTFLILCYGLSIRVASLFNKKAALWVKGRKNSLAQVEKTFSESPFNTPGRKLAWFHCASLGEFEQGRPILENFKQQQPDYLILLTFFSPSGYEVRRAYSEADCVLYLPLDIPRNVSRFVSAVKPDIVFWVKYEYWYNFLSYLHQKQIPVILVSALFRTKQHFFKPYGKWARNILRGFTKVFVQNDFSKSLLGSVGITNAEVSGDTRFDRVATVASSPANIEIAKAFASDHTVMVAGSTWPADEELIFRFMAINQHTFRLIIAPHEIHPAHIQSLLLKAGGKAVQFSKTNAAEAANAEILIIDSIGMLSQLYQYGTLAYIGGGFGVGIHNILEAAAFGLPVFFGPNYQKFMEAKDLIGLKGAFAVKSAEELTLLTNDLFSDSKILSDTSSVCKQFVSSGCGATSLILNYVNGIIASGK